MAAKDYLLAQQIARAVYDFDPNLVLYGLAGSALIQAALDIGLRAASEVFADRSYQDDGSLTPRNQPNAMIEDIDAAVAQVKQMVLERMVRSVHGNDVPVRADTLCIHGDQPSALAFVKRIRQELRDAGIATKALGTA
jgi:UPF0271 protein